MAELTHQERLQPSLLDRLTDDEPGQSREARNRRVLTTAQLRERVLRDLNWLLNSVWLEATTDLSECPFVAHSVLNYGVPDFAGLTSSSIDAFALERIVRQAILNFEPRIQSNTLRVRVVGQQDEMGPNALTFEIEGELWARPIPIELFLKTEVDLETGHISVREFAA